MDPIPVKPSPPQQAPTVEEPTTCRECRRRKVKCDGVMPVCSICRKYRRHCLYDKHSRTRLTRRQLTLLEERLEKAETVLRRHYTDGQIAEMLEGPKEGLVTQNQQAPAATPATAPESAPTPALTLGTTPGLGGLPNATPTPGNVDNLLQLPNQTPDSSVYMTGTGNAGTFTTDPLLLAPIGELDAAPGLWTASQDTAFEATLAPADNFEWNEQETSWGTYDPATWSITNHVDGNPQAIMDGMASLTIGDQKRGYYGAASGSALLRQILSARPDGEEVDAEVALHEIESLFQQHSDHSQWFRSQAMLTRVAVENLIDAFFVFYHPTFPIVHEPTFRAQYAGTLPCANKGHWNTLANILAALGSFASSNVADATDLPIFQAAQKSLFSNYLEVGNLTLVQAFSLSSNYMQKRNKPNTGFNYGGLAIRLAIGLGLHKDLEGNSLSPLQTETRRRIWWCLCVLDVGATITYGRPLNWPQAGVETAFPLNIHEKDLTQDSTHCPPEVEGITMYTYIRVQSAYHLSTMTVYNRLITSPFPSATELITLDDVCIGSWLAQVPYYYLAVPPPDSEFALGMGISEWRYRNLRIVMYRPFLVRWARSSAQNAQQNLTSSENLAVFRCLDAAKESITHIQGYWTSRSHSRLAAFYILYFLFHATLIPVHCLRQNPHHALAPDWRAQIQASLSIMGAMAELNPNSSKCRDITLKLCWPHLEEEGARTYCDNAPFVPSVGDSEAASIINGYNTWCESMTNAGISVPYDWADDNDSALGFF
ncbi:regulatory GAL4 [Fusarium subglutinans]|uniref:Regulatory GAL4 n=1 Tax=Gibberella subglutinans TaxID=42677 RepID=A0A8H5QCG4_GIBSU|nr:regulatory GAL4 [Fusarium subglutinans]KAF5611391.1 regulatory GAL4 [Fusarium subglutinans]